MQKPCCPRLAFTLVELLVTLAIIGVLISLLVPAVQKVREAAAALQCKNNLKQISLATVQFHETQKAFPPARIMERPLANDPPEFRWGGAHPSWFARILPFVDQQAASLEWTFNKPFADHPTTARERLVSVFLCPTRRGTTQAAVAPASPGTEVKVPCGCSFPSVPLSSGSTGDYAGNHGDLSPGSSGLPSDFYYGGYGTGVIISCRGTPTGWQDKIRIREIIDGTSNTVLVGEMHVLADKLSSPTDNGPIYDGTRFYNMSRVGGPGVPLAQGATDSMNGFNLFAFGSWHTGICQFAFADGRAVSISTSINTTILERLCNRSDGEPIPEF